eukprot:TRINITY_DN28226_c0_g1_i1.p1 TRINITY_DN28226_c0_g1~~TRINITY_DN28226_c0_g1_i1.p1  ORF type:complete len:775 (-),score=126.03 TRINITY_DN28226_c0_g1_i1:30-2354(-)
MSSEGEQTALLQVAESGKRDGDTARIPYASLLRLIGTWLAAIVCGGVTPGAVVFNDLFAEAGVFEGACKAGASTPCKAQYLVVGGVLQGLGGLIYLGLLPGGMLLDSVGARIAGTVGALILSAGVVLLAVATATGADHLFILAVVVVDIGSMVNNFSLYGFFWHLPGWQSLIIALSNGCVQVSAILPVILQQAMKTFGLSLPSVLLGYAAVGCCSGGVCWITVPSQAEMFDEARRVLGLPIPRPPRFSWRQFWAELVSGHGIMKVSGVIPGESIVLFLVLALGSLSMYVYSSQAVLFGRELFHSKEAGEHLGDLSALVTACVGALGTPFIGAAVDFLGLQVLATSNAVAILAIVILLSTPSWRAQILCISCSAFYVNSFMLYMLRWMAIIAPPHRFGILQGMAIIYLFAFIIPLSVGMMLWVNSFGSDAGLEQYAIPMRSMGVCAILGWSLVSFRLFCMALPEMVLSPSDEKELMLRFRLQTLADAEIVLALPRKEILRLIASNNMLEQKKLVEMPMSPDVKARYKKLALERGQQMPAAESTPKEVAVEVSKSMHVKSLDPNLLIPALVDSWNGEGDSPGEPMMGSILQLLERSDPSRRKALESMIGVGVAAGHHFGYALGLQSAEEILGVCICYPPKSLEDGVPFTAGGQRDFFLHAQYGEQGWLDQSIWMQLPPEVLERAKSMKVQETMRQNHPKHPHWYVNMLGIIPGQRGKGFSKLLLAPVFEWASKDSVPCYLECAKENVPIYRKLGFDVIWSDETAGQEMHGMSRPPQ